MTNALACCVDLERALSNDDDFRDWLSSRQLSEIRTTLASLINQHAVPIADANVIESAGGMESIDDGGVAITIESRGGTIRAIPGLIDGEHPPYIAVGEVTGLSGGIVKLHAFAGQLSRRHMRLILRLLLRQGYHTAYIDRAAGHVIPLATRIESGDWAGWWRLDLRAAART